MKTVSITEYEKRKVEFLKKHGLHRVETTPLDEYETYRKTYICEDNTLWYEVNKPSYEVAQAEVEVKGIKFKLCDTVKLFKTEGWSTENAESIICYDKF